MNNPSTDIQWAADILGPDFQAHVIALDEDDEGEVIATLIRHRPASGEETAPLPTARWRWSWAAPRPAPTAPPQPARLILYLHGWNDYFFQRDLAAFWHAQGAQFYALDLRKYGRSLREEQTPGYVDDLATYDAEIDAAISIMRDEHGTKARISLLGHSTGGLIASLWAHRHPGVLSSVILNSPWLELQGSTMVRMAAAPIIKGLARIDPKHAYPNIDLGFNARTISGFEWNDKWRPTPSFAVRRGWISAVMDGHRQIAEGIEISCPVLVLTSSRSLISPIWSEEMMQADVVLDVPAIWHRSVRLGPHVTLIKIDNGLHDLALSAPEPRAKFYGELAQWSSLFGWLDPSGE